MINRDLLTRKENVVFQGAGGITGNGSVSLGLWSGTTFSFGVVACHALWRLCLQDTGVERTYAYTLCKDSKTHEELDAIEAAVPQSQVPFQPLPVIVAQIDVSFGDLR